jgi:hypothetical protein
VKSRKKIVLHNDSESEDGSKIVSKSVDRQTVKKRLKQDEVLSVL